MRQKFTKEEIKRAHEVLSAKDFLSFLTRNSEDSGIKSDPVQVFTIDNNLSVILDKAANTIEFYVFD